MFFTVAFFRAYGRMGTKTWESTLSWRTARVINFVLCDRMGSSAQVHEDEVIVSADTSPRRYLWFDPEGISHPFEHSNEFSTLVAYILSARLQRLLGQRRLVW